MRKPAIDTSEFIIPVAFAIFAIVFVASIFLVILFLRHGPLSWEMKIDGAAIGGFGAAIAGFLQVVVLLVQATILRKQTTEQKHLATQQTKITNDQKDIANSMLRLSEELPTRTQRAYVYVKHVDSGKAQVVLRNYGQTPAKSVVASFTYPRSIDEVEPLEELFRQLPQENGEDVIGPSDDKQFEMPIGEAKYIYGLITYKDVFPNTPYHYTEFFAERKIRNGETIFVIAGGRNSDGDRPGPI
jgi:hypothetical protein